MESIEDLAKECLNCKKPMCKKGCPVLTSIPEFIECIKNNKMEEAYKLLQDNNIMSEICSIICPVENQCVGHCIKGIKSNAVRIEKLEEFVNVWARKNNITYKIETQDNKKEKIAIIGGGPAGISCAVELRKLGYDVTIFEKNKKIGGVLEYEIPDYRLSKTYINEIEDKIKNIEIKINSKVCFGKDLSIKDLEEQGFKAVFLGIGAYVPKMYKLTQKDCSNIYTADTVLKKYHNKEKINNFGNVIVIGGGNVAMDVARTLNHVGNNEVTVVYRRTEELMPAIKKEKEEAMLEGVKFIYNTRVTHAICDEKNQLKKIKCIKTKIENEKAIDITGSDFEIDLDSVVFAIGLGIDEKLLNELGIKTTNGLVEVDENNMTNKERNFCRRRSNRKEANSMQRNS